MDAVEELILQHARAGMAVDDLFYVAGIVAAVANIDAVFSKVFG